VVWIRTRRRLGFRSLEEAFLAHDLHVEHVVRTDPFALAAAPRFIAFLALRVVEKAIHLTVGALRDLAGAPVVLGWLAAVVGQVFEVCGAVLCADDP